MKKLVCEYCGKEQDGSYGSGRFCSKTCRLSFIRSAWHQRCPYLPYKVRNTKLNVSRNFIEEYRTNHQACEICGKQETKTARNGSYKGNRTQRLCVDHDHQTNEFRGLLCDSCNKLLGKYEKYKDEIDYYLNREKPI